MNKYFRNTERLADIDEGALWTAEEDKPDIYTLADQDDLRQIGPGWCHIMSPVPDPNEKQS